MLGGYGQFCPVSMASEILCSRWTTLVIRELLSGTTRFNDLRRGVPRMSPALLSKRLKELEKAGVIEKKNGGAAEYRLTAAGEDLRGIIMGLGFWGTRWVESQLSLRNLDPSLLMWDMRRNLNPEPLPPRRCTIQFQYPELSAKQKNWWLVVDGGEVDLCNFDPGFDIDLMVRSSLRSMTAIWMGLAKVRAEVEAGALELDGDPAIARAMQQWLGLSPFAGAARA
ncbi:HxlR family transcriptional regulator [Mesorhizobium sp. L-8-10]|uniref:winged helix-turn-helix transcriptional regulator n=1 Tax=Mesorhizobium sp. L-8-10 TaxID=2744523 RepID=UPI001926B891|nr:helix-turn-helix domain-containing protein [Mesorhizobium sp. L-8-10]BCH33397.1 HxlR family transcriptional regulator [Mesorhizobium sp. L-8-10]